MVLFMAHFEKAPEGCRQEQKKGDAANAAPPHTVKKASQSLRPQAQIKSKLFSPAACTSGKILFALQVWNFCAESAEIMRAAGCNPLQTRAQRSGSRGERRRDGERELCRRRQSERFEVRADEGRAAAASVIPGKFIRKRERPVAVLFFCLLKKPRRILCHHGRKHPDPFSLAACAWKKTRPAPRVRGLFPDSRQMMRAAG